MGPFPDSLLSEKGGQGPGSFGKVFDEPSIAIDETEELLDLKNVGGSGPILQRSNF